MQRRTLLQAAAALPWLSGASLVNSVSGAPAADVRPAHAFVDTRFPRAGHFARSLDPLARWVPVDGDVTRPWQSLLRPSLAGGRVLVVGVTTESFPFCLEILAREHGAPRLQQWRCDRDLIAWRLEVRPHG